MTNQTTKISIGDLVEITTPRPCCGNALDLGKRYIVHSLKQGTLICLFCNQSAQVTVAVNSIGNARICVTRLKVVSRRQKKDLN